jgi:hypothetical protein
MVTRYYVGGAKQREAMRSKRGKGWDAASETTGTQP